MKFVLGLLLTFTSVAALANPAQTCRMALSRYDRVPVSMYEKCKWANNYSAEADDVYTQIYTRSMDSGFLDVLLSIHNQDQLDCTVAMARRYDGEMTAAFLQRVCF